jgi:hypothetical protein
VRWLQLVREAKALAAPVIARLAAEDAARQNK